MSHKNDDIVQEKNAPNQVGFGIKRLLLLR